MTGDGPDTITPIKINDKMVSDIVETEATHTKYQPNIITGRDEGGVSTEY